MGLLEWATFMAGGDPTSRCGYTRDRWTEDSAAAAILGWMQALALPYFVTWFYSYSYHYRLSFAIVPLMLMPTAVILARWLMPERMPGARRLAYLAVVALIGLPGAVITLHDQAGGWNWLWTDTYPDDYMRYRSENPSLIINVGALLDWERAHDRQPAVLAPGGQLFPFFLPLADIHTDETPTRLGQLEGFTHYVYSRHASWW
jgi:hypothetical protein